MDSEGISYVVPVYNAEKSVERCLLSIINEINSNDEVIIIDDGSNDNSLNICQKYAVDSNVILVTQNNMGVAKSRNLGTRLSSKKWVAYVDADDYMVKQYRKVFEHYESSADDFILFSQIVNHENDTACKHTRVVRFSDRNREELILNCFRARQHFAEENKCNSRTVWGKLFNRQFILNNDIFFPEDVIMGEDMLFMLQVYSCFSCGRYIETPVYHYFYDHLDSVTNKYKPHLSENILHMNQFMERWLEKHPQYTGAFDSYYLNTIIIHLRDDFFHRENTRDKNELEKHIHRVIQEGQYKEKFRVAQKTGELRYYPVPKRILFFIAVHENIWLLHLIYRLRYER